jgi:inorganic triphosphatase YgiF
METELKFALAQDDPTSLEKQLARVGLIGRRKAKCQQLHSTYYDTPEHDLQQAAIALRVRRIGDAPHAQWVQTLKIGGRSDSALSQRGEWERALPTERLDRAILHDTPWAQHDPEGAWSEALTPVFVTTFERLSWIVKRGDARVEVALDRGSVQMDGHSTPLCELEIELLSGAPAALFDVAEQISRHLALLPLHMSKAERAYRLAQGTLDAPLRARPPALNRRMEFSEVVQCVLRESFLQFSANLNTLCNSDAPEVLHQARVGWRRFKSALKLLGQLEEDSGFPALAPLKPLLQHLTQLRDLEVAASEVFPLYAAAYQEEDARRRHEWQQLEATLARTIGQQRAALRQTLAQPGPGIALLQITRWLEMGQVHPHPDADKPKKHPYRKWLRQRVAHLAAQLDAVPPHPKDALLQHRTRIISKRLRYSVESLRDWLPEKHAERWLLTAIRHQTHIGRERDRQQALATAQRLQAAQGIVDFLRGAAFSACLVTDAAVR